MRRRRRSQSTSDDVESYRLDGGTLSLGCQNCGLLALCGGEFRVGGSLCDTRCIGCDESCDLVCLGKPERLAAAMREVGGFGFQNISRLNGLSSAPPPYVPMIQHGSGRTERLDVEWAAIPLSAAFRRPKGVSLPVASNAEELRLKFQIASSTRLLLIGTGPDKEIERYWKWHRMESLSAALSALGFAGAVVPNYSFFLDHPRPQHLHNRKRSLICAADWSAAGIPAIPYLQAVSASDWDFWYQFLRRHEEVSVVAKEFRTGAAKRNRGLIHLDELARLQDRLGRSLHVVAIGAAQYREELAWRFGGRTIVDSNPFMKAIHRKRAQLGVNRVNWKLEPTGVVDEILPFNIGLWSWWLTLPGGANDRTIRRGSKRVDRRQLKIKLAS